MPGAGVSDRRPAASPGGSRPRLHGRDDPPGIAEQLLEQPHDRGLLVGVYQLADVVSRHLARGISQRWFERLRAVHDRPRLIQERDDIARMLDETAEPLF